MSELSGLFLSLPPSARVAREAADRAIVRYGPIERTFIDSCAACLDALQQLTGGGADEDHLARAISTAGGDAALMRFQYWLHVLGALRLLARSTRDGECPIATLMPVSPGFAYSGRVPIAGTAYRLSRFAHTRMHNGDYVLESPRSHGRVVLHDARSAALVFTLARPIAIADSPGAVAALAPEACLQTMALLLNADMLTEVTGDGAALEDEDRALRCWEFHDLLFHGRSRAGRYDAATGGDYRFAGQFDPPPPLRAPAADATIALDRPAAHHDDAGSFPAVQQARSSIRQYGANPLTVATLGEFLYRVGRVTSLQTVDVSTPAGRMAMGFTRRPYPSGGAMYELEIYPVVHRCDGLASGLYRYDPLNHRLETISGRTSGTDALLTGASIGTGIPADHLQVLLVITSRFQRMSWKYASMAYAATLKNVGVLMQTMYLVATAMQLAPCAIGCGDSDIFARSASTEYYEETSVGEFLLGSRPGP